MSTLTSALFAVFGIYVAGWMFGVVDGNFATVIFFSTVVTGLYWIADRLYFLPQRKATAKALAGDDESEARLMALKQPWWLDWTAGIFPVLIATFFLRSFLVEPFKVPSGSMIPTLQIGDLIVVNKFTYGLRIPVVNKKITQGNAPRRGDVMVFRYPVKPSIDYIKRVVGMPGDTVAYINKRVVINGVPLETTALPEFLDETSMKHFKQFEEAFGDKKHKIINDDKSSPSIPDGERLQGTDACQYTSEGVTCKVPQGQYFMLGDNRDNSVDSRYWGFVPEQNIVGKAFFVWMNFSNIKRIGSFD